MPGRGTEGTEKTRLPGRKFANDEGNRVPTYVEMWKERSDTTPTGLESQSVEDRGHDTVIHVEMWKERQNITIDTGQREETAETEHHVRKTVTRNPMRVNNYKLKTISAVRRARNPLEST